MAGRPREFDTEQALERAMEVFWADGYEAASVQTLLDAMGINRGSMYDTFGDKHALFLAAIEHYGTTVFRCFEQDLACPGPVLECIRRTLRRMGQGERGGARQNRGFSDSGLTGPRKASMPVVAAAKTGSAEVSFYFFRLCGAPHNPAGATSGGTLIWPG